MNRKWAQMSFFKEISGSSYLLNHGKINIDKDELVKKSICVYLKVLTLFNPVP